MQYKLDMENIIEIVTDSQITTQPVQLVMLAQNRIPRIHYE